jgi:hypothetical protein
MGKKARIVTCHIIRAGYIDGRLELVNYFSIVEKGKGSKMRLR